MDRGISAGSATVETAIYGNRFEKDQVEFLPVYFLFLRRMFEVFKYSVFIFQTLECFARVIAIAMSWRSEEMCGLAFSRCSRSQSWVAAALTRLVAGTAAFSWAQEA